MTDPDVIVIGAGGGGPVIAKELGEAESMCWRSKPGLGMEIKNGRSRIKIVERQR
ncbi:hypothetical protein [Virgibacillus sp. CBA3643]|uniref:hypothetical protein n=1 Tax=Virgibacillus sp. CBA3643 TaxID=2942278 RepID=UPI0035A27713